MHTKELTIIGDVSELVTFTRTGLVLRAGISEEQSVEVLKYLRGIGTSMEFYIGDWQLQHTETFGEESTTKALQQLEFDFVHAVRCKKLAGIPVEIRNPKLSTAHHHAVLRQTKNPDEQVKLLDMVEDNKLSVMEASRSVRAGRVITKEDIKASCPSRIGFYTMQAIRLDFDRWLKQANPEEWGAAERETFIKEFRPIYDLYVQQQAIK